MPYLTCLVTPPLYPHYLCYRYFCRYSCAISGVYNSVVRLMPDISSHFSDNYRQTSGGHLPRVGFGKSEILKVKGVYTLPRVSDNTAIKYDRVADYSNTQAI